MLFAAVWCLIVGGCGRTSAANAPVASKAEVEAATKSFIQAWEKKDLAAVTGAFSNDAMAFDPVPPGRFDGAAGIHAWVAGDFQVLSQISITISDLRIQTMGPVAWVTSRYVFKAVMDGQPAGDAGNLSLVWVKQPDGAYKLSVFHASVPPPATPPPAKK